MFAVGEGWSVEGQPYVVAGSREFEDRPQGSALARWMSQPAPVPYRTRLQQV
ncbi:hypothetical protein ABNF97_16975 [Plantactinospora sp. B6F1]